jgi:uncharacterized protein YsxB (DUF464 family)
MRFRATSNGGSVLAVVVVCAAFSAIVFGTVASIAECSVVFGGSTMVAGGGSAISTGAFAGGGSVLAVGTFAGIGVVSGIVASNAECSVASGDSTKVAGGGSVLSTGAFGGGCSVLAIGAFAGIVVVCANFSAIVFVTGGEMGGSKLGGVREGKRGFSNLAPPGVKAPPEEAGGAFWIPALSNAGGPPGGTCSAPGAFGGDRASWAETDPSGVK